MDGSLQAGEPAPLSLSLSLIDSGTIYKELIKQGRWVSWEFFSSKCLLTKQNTAELSLADSLKS